QSTFPAQIGLWKRVPAVWHGCVDGHLPLLESRPGGERVEIMNKGHAKQRSGGGSQSLRLEGTNSALREQDAGGPEGLRGRDPRSGVAWLLHAIEEDPEDLPPEGVVQAQFRRSNQREHALSGLCSGQFIQKVFIYHGKPPPAIMELGLDRFRRKNRPD